MSSLPPVQLPNPRRVPSGWGGQEESPYEDFYQTFVMARRSWKMMRVPFMEVGNCNEIYVGECDEEGGIDWQLVKPKEAIRPHVEALETQFGVTYPESFKRWFGMYYSMDMDCGVVRLPECNPNDPMCDLRGYLEYGSKLLEVGMLPFGGDGNDVGALCFDQRGGCAEPSIVLWDHELTPADPDALPELMYDSFDAMIRFLTVEFQKWTLGQA